MENITKRQAELEMYDGLKVYGENDKRIEFLTLTKNPDETFDIYKKFTNEFCQRLLYKGRFGSIDFYLVIVDHQHMHILIKKPFIKIHKIHEYWNNVTHQKNSSLVIKTVKGDKTDKKQMERLVTYIITQGDKHNTDDIIFKKSMNWGIVAHKKRIKTEKKVSLKTNRYYGSKEEYLFIEGEMVLASDYYAKNESSGDLDHG